MTRLCIIVTIETDGQAFVSKFEQAIGNKQRITILLCLSVQHNFLLPELFYNIIYIYTSMPREIHMVYIV